MVKLYAISVLRRSEGTTGDGNGTCVLLKGSYDLQSVGFFQRASVQEFLIFTSNMLVERTPIGVRRTVKEGGKSHPRIFEQSHSRGLRL